MASRRILVTGGAGFIGSHTADALLARGDRVTILDNFNDYYDPSRKRKNIEEVRRNQPAHAELEVVEGDLRDRELVSQLVGKGFDAIVHLAAMAGVRASVENPWLYYDVNLTGTLNLLEAARVSGKPNFVFAGTSSAYGTTQIVPFIETDPSDRPLAPYPASKRAAEMLGYSYHHLHGLDFTALRFFTVYGPRGRPDMMAYKVLDSVRLGQPIPLYNGGQMHRDWTFVSDIVAGVVGAADRRLGFEVINLGRGEPILLADFVASIESLAGRKANLVPAPMMDADVAYTFADIDKARRLLGYEPKVGVGDGVRRFFEWYVENVGRV
jgi:UDP-glucuronate 4-epimerase